MSRSIIRPFYRGSNIAIAVARPCRGETNGLFLKSERSICRLSLSTPLKIRLLSSLTVFWKASTESENSRTVRAYASLAKSGQRTSWDEAANAYFSDVARESGDSDSWERGEQQASGRRDAAVSTGRPLGGGRRRETHSSGPELISFSEGSNRSRSPATSEPKDFGGGNLGYGGDRSGRATRWQKSGSAIRERRDVDRRSGYGGERHGSDQWRKPPRVFRSKRDGTYHGRSSGDDRTRDRKSEWSTSEEYERGADDSHGFDDDQRWQSTDYSSDSALQAEGQALYGVAPIISALQVSRRKLYCLYMQENLRQNIGNGKRKDKSAVLFIEKTVKSMGVTVKEASKHQLNMLTDNRPHQGLVLDASPLELVPVEMLDAPLYQDNKPPPMWVALDEVTDPQNFGAILRSAHFLGAEGVVVCAKNSAPLSGVVSKASAGALELMEVHFCKNMMKFLDRCKENGWRVVGASAEPKAVPVGELPHGIATILVLGNEGKGLRTNVKRACDLLISIGGVADGYRRPKSDNTDFITQDLVGLELEEDEDEAERRGAELGFMPGSSAVDSLNVSVAAGIMLYELLG